MKRLLLVGALAACAGEPETALVWGHAVLLGLDDHSGITLTLSDGDSAVTTDAFGYFAFPHVPRGRYFVTAAHLGTFERQASAAIDHDGQTPSGAYLSLTPFGRAAGTVRTADGSPVVGATVAVLGHEARATSVEGGSFAIDPSPAGDLRLLATATSFAPATAALRVGAGGSGSADLVLEPAAGPDPYAENDPPEVSAITLEATPDDTEPRAVPLVDAGSGRVRRRGLYALSVATDDPDRDEVNVYWTADRGTLLATFGHTVLWRAGAGTSTIVATAVDARGATALVRRVLESSVDGIRGAGRAGDRIYYSERRGDTFDVFSYDLSSGDERLEVGGELQQHGATIADGRLVWSETEFVFISGPAYRVRARPLAGGADVGFGQTLGHDDNLVVRLDLYTPLAGRFLPYHCSDAAIAPVGYGYVDLGNGNAAAAFDPAASPANNMSFARDGDRDVWLTASGQLLTRTAGGPDELLQTLPHTTNFPQNVELDGNVVALLYDRNVPLYFMELGGTLQSAGLAASSMSFEHPYLVWVEQGPSVASVELLDVVTGERRTLSSEPHFFRRIWYMDDEVVVWGDQGVEGQTFVAQNTELLWVARLR